MQAIILAGGLGTRLRPVTYEIPKPLVPVKKKPILNHHIAFFVNAGIKEIILIVHISDTADFERWSKTWDDQAWMKKVRIVYEHERRGTFGALHAAKHVLKKETFILSNGDSLMQFDIKAFLKAHKEFEVLVTTALVNTYNPLEYGLAVLNDHFIDHFTTDPSEANSGFISAGLYAIEPEVLEMLGEEGEQSMERDILPSLSLRKENAGAITRKNRFYECGTLSRWEQAIKEW